MKRRYQGVCRGCGAPTAARGGKGDAYEFCKHCHPGAIAPTRTRDWVRDAMHEWRAAIRQATVVNRLVSDARPQARRRGARAISSPRLAGAFDRHRHLRVLACRSRRRVPRRLTDSVGRGHRPRCPVPTKRGVRPAFAAQPRSRPARRRSTTGTSCRSRTPPSCSSASAASARTFKACAS